MQLQENPIPIDYLDKIAPPQKAPARNNKLFFMIIAGVILTVALVGGLIASSGQTKSKPLEILALRLQTLQKVSEGAQTKIKSSGLRSINGNLTTFLVNTNRDIATPLEANKIILTKLDKKVIAREDGAELLATLEDARLNATYDRAYAHEMSYQLETLVVLMTSIYNTTGSKSLKEFLEPSFDNLTPIQEQFSKFNAANS